MKPIPESVAARFAGLYRTSKADLAYMAGGQHYSDGILYEYTEGGKKKVLKLMELSGADAAKKSSLSERLDFVRFLGERGVPIVFPHPSANGNLYEEIRDGDTLYVAYQMDKAPGAHIHFVSSERREWFYAEWGRIVGQLHACAKMYPYWRRSPVEAEGKPVLCWENEWEGFAKWCKDDEVREAWKTIRKRLESLPVNRDGFGFIHNDPHLYNLLIDHDRITVLDFDVANYHWFATDIAIAVYSALAEKAGGFEKPQREKDFAGRMLELFMKGYEEENHLDGVWLDRLELFLSYRRILMYIVFYEEMQKNKSHADVWRSRILSDSPVLAY